MSDRRPTAVIVLAAGEGTRMKSTTPKVLHTIGGRSLVAHAIRAARGTSPQHLAVVVRHERDRVAEHVRQVDPEAVVADQDDVKGTGRAVECALDALPADLSGTVRRHVRRRAAADERDARGAASPRTTQSGSAVTVITATLEDPTGYGRVIRDADGSVVAIVEQKDADEQQRAIREVNSGFYAFDAAVLRDALAEVGTDNAQGEKYLTDVIAHRARPAARRAAPTSSPTCGRPRASTTRCSWPASARSSTAAPSSRPCATVRSSSTPPRRGSTRT